MIMGHVGFFSRAKNPYHQVTWVIRLFCASTVIECQNLFSGGNKKIFSNCRLLNFFPNMLSAEIAGRLI